MKEEKFHGHSFDGSLKVLEPTQRKPCKANNNKTVIFENFLYKSLEE